MRQVKKKRMRKVIVTVIMVLLLGCTHRAAYNPPDYLKIEMNRIAAEVLRCIQPKNRLAFYISDSQQIGAWTKENKIIFTEGMFRTFDDDTLKFVMAHEIAHDKLGHINEIRTISLVTTGTMMVVNAIVPGAGYLDYLINPAVTNNYSKTQELEADKEASKACLCLGISLEQQIEIMENLKSAIEDGGGFWARHPSWDDRIVNIKTP